MSGDRPTCSDRGVSVGQGGGEGVREGKGRRGAVKEGGRREAVKERGKRGGVIRKEGGGVSPTSTVSIRIVVLCTAGGAS